MEFERRYHKSRTDRDNEPGRVYRENYIDLGGQRMMVVRNELFPHEYAYTPEAKEKAMVQDYALNFGSYEKRIDDLFMINKSTHEKISILCTVLGGCLALRPDMMKAFIPRRACAHLTMPLDGGMTP